MKTYWVWWNKDCRGDDKKWWICEVVFAHTNEPLTATPIAIDKLRAHAGDCVQFETIVTPSGRGVFSFNGSVQYIEQGSERIAVAS